MSDSYAVPPRLVREFTPQELTEFRKFFGAFDADGNGTITRDELLKVVQSLGERVSSAALDALLEEADLDKSGGIEFGEFVQLIHSIRTGSAKKGASTFERLVTKSNAAIISTKGATGTHAFSEAERTAFTEHINKCLAGDPDLPMLPLDPTSNDLFRAVRDGILLCKLINKAVPDTVDERALNKKKARELNIYEITENQNLCLGATKAIGCVVVNIGPNDLVEGTPHLVLGLIWQVVKIQLLAAINLKAHPQLVRLLEEGEELTDLLRQPPEQLLLRWFNFHLRASGNPRRVANFGSDLADSECYTVLLHQILADTCDTLALRESDLHKRAQHVIRNAQAMEVPTFIQPDDIVSANKRLNLAFCAQLFNTRHGLEVSEAELVEMAGIMDDDAGDSREERVFRMWINSLGMEDVYVHNLFEDLRDGVVILQLMDKIRPGIVSWRRVNRVCKNKFKRVENCNYVVVLGKQMNLSLVNIGGLDIVDGNKKLILAVIWQLMRAYTLQLLSSLAFEGRDATEDDIIRWANDRVAAKGRESRMESFRDRSLRDSRFLMDLLFSIEPRVVNWDLFMPGDTDEERMNNAKYVISVARKIGAVVFLTWEDITEVKPKMIMTFVASLMATMNKRVADRK